MTPPNEIDLHRLVWSPDDYVDGKLLPSAFPSGDLKTPDRYLSVDRVDQFNPDATIETANRQAENADGATIVREDAFSALLGCGEVRGITDHEGKHPLEVRPEPIKGVNLAHCGISNVSGKKSRGYVNQLRTELTEIVNRILSLEMFVGEVTDGSGET
ncbi:MAG: hypothetical protein ABJM82_04490 [Shimia thalassica]|uniref:hypothetical protein n=1 Tax=Shimia thalassica TaxID=1715693 RepID=UPI0032989B80